MAWTYMKHSCTCLYFEKRLIIPIIIITVCCATILLFSQTSSFRHRNIMYPKNAPGNSSRWMTHHFPDGIHIVLVSINRVFNEMAVNAVKSIMFHRRKPYNITFHIFTDLDGEKRINDFSNLTVSHCTQFRIYSAEELLHIGKNFLEKHQMVTTHYSGIFALSKAFIHEVLPINLHRVLLIDTDILFLDDIYSVWEQFQLFERNKTALGLAPWYPYLPLDYQYQGSGPDPFLTGVVLLDLDVCRSINLTQLVSQATASAQKRFGLKSLWTADQVVLGLFATYFSEYFVALPCFTNGHTIHYLKNALRWKSSCGGEYPRNVHVVPSSDLLNKKHYLGHLYAFFKEMPVEWLSYCGKIESLRKIRK